MVRFHLKQYFQNVAEYFFIYGIKIVRFQIVGKNNWLVTRSDLDLTTLLNKEAKIIVHDLS